MPRGHGDHKGSLTSPVVTPLPLIHSVGEPLERQHGIPSGSWRGRSHMGMRVTQLSRPMTIIRLPVIQTEAAELRHGAALRCT